MSKDIIIEESGVAKNLNDVDRITTKLVSGNSANWIPEDETELAEISVTSNGQYVASGFGYYGFVKVNVSVAGGSGSEVLPAIGGIDQIDVGTIDLDDVYVEPPVGGIGSTIMGIDPTTGEWTTMTVDGNGNLVQEIANLPKSIRVLTPPAKTSYVEGEKINYSGLTVELLDKDGNTFTSADFPTGVLTWGAPYYFNGDMSKSYGIVTPTANAPSNDGQGTHSNSNTSIDYNDSTINGPVSWCTIDSIKVLNFAGRLSDAVDIGTSKYGGPTTLWGTPSISEMRETFFDGRVLIVSENSFGLGTLYVYASGADPSTTSPVTGYGGVERSATKYNSCYYWMEDVSSYMDTYPVSSAAPPTLDYSDVGKLAEYIMFGFPDGAEIEVEWTSPYDHSTLKTSFFIDVEPSSSGSDDEFSGSGGGTF